MMGMNYPSERLEEHKTEWWKEKEVRPDDNI